MANDNETVEQLCEKLHMLGGEIHRFTILGAEEINNLSHTIDEAQDRIFAAHKRELADKDAEIVRLKHKIEEFERQPEAMADVATQALEALKQQDTEIAKRGAIIKELADVLEWCNKQAESIGKATLAGGLQMNALTMTMAGMSRRCIELVAKVREVKK